MRAPTLSAEHFGHELHLCIGSPGGMSECEWSARSRQAAAASKDGVGKQSV